MRTLLFGLIMMAATCGSGRTAEYRVEKDGSGDFLEIQEAVEFAADGDTVQVGPGRWSKMVEYVAPAWTDSSVVVVEDKGLTLIGAGRGVTILGPELMPEFNVTGPFCVLVVSDREFVIEDMTLEHAGSALYAESSVLRLKGMDIMGARIGVVDNTTSRSEYSESQFKYCTDVAVSGYHMNSEINIRECVFSGVPNSNCTLLSLQSIESLLVDNCSFEWGYVQIAWQESDGLFRGCRFVDSTGALLGAVAGAKILLESCDFIGGAANQLVSSGDSEITGYRNIFHGAAGGWLNSCTIRVANGLLDMSDNHILLGNGKYLVYAVGGTYGFDLLDMRNNWWGITDTDSLDALIWDQHDDDSIPSVIVYDPVLEGPVPAENGTVSDLKKLFR